MSLKDLLPKHQLELMDKKIGKKYLNLELPTKAENIIEGEWTLTKEEKDGVIQLLFGVDVKGIDKVLAKFKPTEHFLEIFELSRTTKDAINLLKPSIIDIKMLNSNSFKLINVGETKGDKMILRNDNGHPITEGLLKMPKKVDKKKGEIVFSNNKSNFNAFLESYNSACDAKIENPFMSREFTEVLSYVKQGNFDFELFTKFDLQLYISSKPEDMLNMSISKFYDSCQNLYSGAQNNCLAPNLFDKNCKIAYLKFNTPYTDRNGNVMPFTSFTRCIVRNIKGRIYFDMVYPKFSNDLRLFVHSIIEKYTGMKNSFADKESKTYYYTEVGLGRPYFDSVIGVPIKFNPDAYKDIKLQALAKFLKTEADYILEADKNVYGTDQGDFLVLSIEEALNATKHYITEEMIYKQDIYKKYVDIEKFFEENKSKCLVNYSGSCDFDEITKWAEEPPTPKKEKKKKRDLNEDDDERRGSDLGFDPKKFGGNNKHNITKHNLYRFMKPYLDSKFWEERLTDESISSKRNKLSVDENEINMGDYFAYKQEIKKRN